MSNVLTELSSHIATAVDRAAAGVVQVHGHHRPVAGVVFADDLIMAPGRGLTDDTATIRLPSGNIVDGAVLGHAVSVNFAVIRVSDLNVQPLVAAEEPRVGHLAVAVGRTWSGGVMATLTNVAVVGGPLRTSRTSEIDRVIRIAQAPHGALTGGALVDGEGRALGLITSSAIRGTTVVLPSAFAWRLGHQIVSQGGTRQGFIGISTMAVAVPQRQRSDAAHSHGLLVTSIVSDSPAETAGVLVGDVIVEFDGHAVHEPEALVMLLRGDRVGKNARLKVLGGSVVRDLEVTVSERQRTEPRDRRRGR